MGRGVVIFVLRLIAVSLIVLAFAHVYQAIMGIITGTFQIWQLIIIVIQLIIEILIFTQTSSMIYGLSSAVFDEDVNLDPKTLDEYPDLDVYVTIRQVPVDTLDNTLAAFDKDDYPKEKLHLYIADDTPDKEMSEKYRQLADKYNAEYIYDPTNDMYKAGMINIALPKGNSEYVAFFDYDQKPLRGILKHFVEVLERHPDRAFIQAKKRFKDLYNLARIWSAMLYVQFFELFEKTKQQNKTVLFAGSTACFRRSAIEKVGGFPENSFTEDSNISTKLLLIGEHGIFSNTYGSIGSVPYGLSAQISQLWRWSHGASHVLSAEFTNIVKSKKLSWGQKIDLMGTLGITPTLVAVYIYSLTFFPLILSNVDSPRLEIFGISTLAYIAVAPAITYFIISVFALWAAKKHQSDEFSFTQLPGFIFIAMASNILILNSGITGLLRIWGPKSNKGQWTRKVNMLPLAIFGFILGIILEYYAIIWLLNGFTSAILLILIGLTLFPTLPVVLYYNRESKK